MKNEWNLNCERIWWIRTVPGSVLDPTLWYLHWGPAPGDVLLLLQTETARWPATTTHTHTHKISLLMREIVFPVKDLEFWSVFVAPSPPRPVHVARVRLHHVCWALWNVLAWLGQARGSLRDEHWRCPPDHWLKSARWSDSLCCQHLMMTNKEQIMCK